MFFFYGQDIFCIIDNELVVKQFGTNQWVDYHEYRIRQKEEREGEDFDVSDYYVLEDYDYNNNNCNLFYTFRLHPLARQMDTGEWPGPRRRGKELRCLLTNQTNLAKIGQSTVDLPRCWLQTSDNFCR